MKESDVVTLKAAFGGLKKGTVGTIVLEYDGSCYEVEFIDDAGDTIAVLTTPSNVLQLAEQDDIAKLYRGRSLKEAEHLLGGSGNESI